MSEAPLTGFLCFFFCRSVVKSNMAVAKDTLSSKDNLPGVNRFKSRTRR